MIQIIDLLTGENFDLPKDFKISIEETNPLLCEQGSVSLPINLPYTRKNAGLTGFLHRIDRSNKYVTRRNIIISAGSFVRKGTLIIVSAQRNAPLSAVILIGESQIYNKSKDLLMTEVFKNEVRNDFTGSLSDKIDQWIDYLNRLMFDDDLDDEMSIFPVTIKDGKITSYIISATIEGVFNFINHVAVPYGANPGQEYYDSENNSLGYRLSAQNAISLEDEGVQITYPAGYAVSPFLKVKYVLSKIFNYLGFNLVSNESFDQMISGLVILNNNIDSIMMGSIYYAQLVPSCTVYEFLKSLCNKYGFEFILDANGVDVSIQTWDEALTLSNVLHLDNYLSSHPVVTFESPKTLKLSRNYPELSKPHKYLSYEELKEKHSEIPIWDATVGIGWSNVFQSIIEKIYLEGGGFSFELTGEYSFDFFEQKEGHEVFEKKSEETFVEMILSDLSSYYYVSQHFHRFCVMPYIPTVRALNTYIQIGNTVKKNDDKKCPIMFCYRAGRYDIDGHGVIEGDSKLTYGTTYSHGDQTLDLNYFRDTGLYHSNWQKLDMMLQNSFHEVKVQLKLPVEKIQKLLSFQLVSIKGQPLLPESIKYEISNESIKIVEAKFRTIKSYE